MKITFQAAQTADIPVIQDLSSRIWREHYPGMITHAQIDYMLGKMYSTGTIRNEMEQQGYRYVVVSGNAEPIGYLAFRHDPDKAVVLLSKIYLLGSYHAKGIGRQMLQYVKDEAKKQGAKAVYLFVNKNNRKAITAYERFGFFKTEAVVTDIGCGFVMDDYAMELRI